MSPSATFSVPEESVVGDHQGATAGGQIRHRPEYVPLNTAPGDRQRHTAPLKSTVPPLAGARPLLTRRWKPRRPGGRYISAAADRAIIVRVPPLAEPRVPAESPGWPPPRNVAHVWRTIAPLLLKTRLGSMFNV